MGKCAYHYLPTDGKCQQQNSRDDSRKYSGCSHQIASHTFEHQMVKWRQNEEWYTININNKHLKCIDNYRPHTHTRIPFVRVIYIFLRSFFSLLFLVVAETILSPPTPSPLPISANYTFTLFDTGTNMCGGCYKDLYGGSYYYRSPSGRYRDPACCPASGCTFSPVQQLGLSECENLCLNETNCNFITFIISGKRSAICQLQLVTSCSFVPSGTSMIGQIYQKDNATQWV